MKTGTTREVERAWLVIHGMKAMNKRNTKRVYSEAEAEKLFKLYDELGQYVDVFTEVTTTEVHVEKLTSDGN